MALLQFQSVAQVRRNSNDMEKFFSDEDVTVDIGEEEQALLLKKAELDCLHKLLDDATSINGEYLLSTLHFVYYFFKAYPYQI